MWPRGELPALEPALKGCGELVMACGLLLAKACDAFVARRGGSGAAVALRRTVSESRCTKARLLHYFPLVGASPAETTDVSTWCGWHVDHGSLTALTCAQYMAGGVEVPCPDPAAGLYIRARSGAVVRAAIPPACLAFQLGAATERNTGGRLVATPHCVRAAAGPAAAGVARNTFAVFMQPNFDVAMAGEVEGATFGSFSEEVIVRGLVS